MGNANANMQWMNEFTHPGLSSDLAVLPASARVEVRGEIMAVICDERSDFWFGNYLVLPKRPDPSAAEMTRAVWNRVFGLRPNVQRMIWVWEGAAEELAPDLADAAVFDQQVVLTLDSQREIPAPNLQGFALRQATDETDVDAVARMISEGTGAADNFCHWRQRAYADLSRSVPGGIWALWRGDTPIATAGFYAVGGIGRFQEVVTAEHHRGRGLATALCSSLVRRYANEPGLRNVVVVAEMGSSAERIYRRIGFEPFNVQSCIIAHRP